MVVRSFMFSYKVIDSKLTWTGYNEAEKYMSVVPDVYKDRKTVFNCAVRETDGFTEALGLHHDSAGIDRLTALGQVRRLSESSCLQMTL